MKSKINYSTVAFGIFFVFSGAVNAQSSFVSTGGELNGSGGSASISVGQVQYQSQTGSNGSSAGGVQQAIEVSNISIQDIPFKNKGYHSNLNDIIALKIYPNPTKDDVIIQVDNFKGEVLNYRLLDITGKELKSGEMLTPEISVSLSDFPPATYFMEVTQAERASVYKIVKSN